MFIVNCLHCKKSKPASMLYFKESSGYPHKRNTFGKAGAHIETRWFWHFGTWVEKYKEKSFKIFGIPHFFTKTRYFHCLLLKYEIWYSGICNGGSFEFAAQREESLHNTSLFVPKIHFRPILSSDIEDSKTDSGKGRMLTACLSWRVETMASSYMVSPRNIVVGPYGYRPYPCFFLFPFPFSFSFPSDSKLA